MSFGAKLRESLRGSLPMRLRPSRIPRQRIALGDLQVLLALPAWTVMRSTDRDYIYERFPQLNEAFRLHFRGNYGARSLALANAQNVIERLGPPLGLPLTFHGALPGLRVDRDVQVIFSYGQFPFALQSNVPILWEHTFAPQRGTDPDAWLALQRSEHVRAATRAVRVVTATEISADWFRRIFPELASKITAIPYYLPHLSRIPEAALAHKISASTSGPVHVVFIGKQARRKGLDTLAAAWPLLAAAVRAALRVTVVSAMYDGPVDLPPEWIHLSVVPDVNTLLREAHVLAFPTKHEAYGLVLVEGMAAGCALLTTSAPVQRSIVGAAAGSFIDPQSPAEVASALSELVRDRTQLGAKMQAAHDRFAACYEPQHVGQRYAELLWASSGRSAADVAR